MFPAYSPGLRTYPMPGLGLFYSAGDPTERETRKVLAGQRRAHGNRTAQGRDALGPVSVRSAGVERSGSTRPVTSREAQNYRTPKKSKAPKNSALFGGREHIADAGDPPDGTRAPSPPPGRFLTSYVPKSLSACALAPALAHRLSCAAWHGLRKRERVRWRRESSESKRTMPSAYRLSGPGALTA